MLPVLKKSLKYLYNSLIVLFLLIFFNLTSCGGGLSGPGGDDNPLAPPAPPIQLPAFATLPDSVDVKTFLNRDGANSVAGLQALQVGSTDNFLKAINSVADTSGFVELFLSNLSDIEFPVSPLVTQFVTEINKDNFFPDIVTIDFGVRDTDGDGIKEDCTGNSCPDPDAVDECPSEIDYNKIRDVCYAIWIDIGSEGINKRFMSGTITVFPQKYEDDPDTEEDESKKSNPGIGAFRGGDVDIINNMDGLGDVGTEALYFDARYNHFDVFEPLKKSSDVIVIREIIDFSLVDPILTHMIWGIVSSEPIVGATDDSQIKTTILNRSHAFGILQGDTFYNRGDFIDVFTNYIAQFREDANFWLGTVELFDPGEFTEPQLFADNQCATIDEGLPADSNVCTDLQLSLLGLEPLVDPDIEELSDFVNEEEFPLNPPEPQNN